jgi:C-terminal processing protease CtpA/Prc
MRLNQLPARAALIAAIAGFAHTAGAQQIPKADRETAETMLKVIASDIRKHYYDPKMHSVDWDAKVAETKDAIDKAPSLNMALSQIAALIDSLNDSHTFMLPPEHSYRHDYGFAYEMLGNQCVVNRVRPHSDAEAKGVNRGDHVLAINGVTPSRDVLWKLQYLFGLLRPQAVLHLQLRSVDGQTRQLDVAAKIHQRKRVTDLTLDNGGSDIFDIIREGEGDEHRMRLRYAEFGDDLLIVKFPEFAFDAVEVQTMVDKARKHKGLIVDLRENGGRQCGHA